MSTTATNDFVGDQPSTPATGKSGRVWPIVLLLAVFWVFLFANYRLDIGMQARFFSRMIAFGVLLLAFLGWWLTRRTISRRDRWLAVGLWIVGMIVASLVGDPTMDVFTLLLSSMPVVLTAWAAWALIARNLSSAVQRIGFCAVLAISLGFFILLRFDGLWGDQRAVFSWRWTETAEAKMLASRKKASRVAEPAVAIGSDAAPEWKLQPGDWAEFRGTNRDGVIRDARFSTDWHAHPPREIWRRRVGPGWSSVIVVDGHVVTQEQRGEMEVVACYSAATGEEEWTHENKSRFSENLSGAGPRGTPTFADGRIFAFGANGQLDCLDAATGKPIWSRDVAKESETPVPIWGFVTSPLVVDRLVVVYVGGTGDRDMVAYRADSGEPAWTAAAGSQSYSSPQVATIDGVRQILMNDDAGMAAYNISDGKRLWLRTGGDPTAFPIVQAQVISEHELLIPSEVDFSFAEVRHTDNEWSISDRWTSDELSPSFSGFAVHDGHIYGLDNGKLCCLNLKTGKKKWGQGDYGQGQVLLAIEQSVLAVSGEHGEIALVAADPAGFHELARIQALTGKTWNHPVLAHGRLYARNGEEMACFELPAPSAAESATTRHN